MKAVFSVPDVEDFIYQLISVLLHTDLYIFS